VLRHSRVNALLRFKPAGPEYATAPPTLGRQGCVVWARQDLNLRPTDYESAALTTELRALAGRKDTGIVVDDAHEENAKSCFLQ
jgi:hypothetical protein